jgi:Leucine-rich repeat (LRR) protein
MQSLVDLTASDNLLTDPLPASLVRLTQLETLYLDSNLLAGSLPEYIGDLFSLLVLDLGDNRFTGRLPSSLASLRRLQTLYLSSSLLTGPIPEDIGNLTSLVELQLEYNFLNSSVPASITTLRRVRFLYLFANSLTGCLPEDLGNMTALSQLELNTNYLSCSLPESITRLQHLSWLYLYQNQLTGTLPAGLGNMTALSQLAVSANQLTGTIPPSITSLPLLETLYLQTNQLTGPIPSDIGSLTLLNELYLYENQLTGPVPASLSSLVRMVHLRLYDNQLTGSVDGLFSSMRQLEDLQLQSNRLTGPIAQLLDWSRANQTSLLDLSDNAFSGSLPEELFQLPHLVYMALVKNCFTGSLPRSICTGRDTLTTLALDGLHTARRCQQRIFPHLSVDTYVLGSTISGSVPSCLFTDMPALTTLHLSGNGLTGSLPAKGQLSPNLTQLSLSHNTLTGTIPRMFQEHPWAQLDLAFNRLTGDLLGCFSNFSATNSSLSLNLNRLSGTIPSSLLHADDIDILSGNMFSCSMDKRQLPRHDSDYGAYDCGSDRVDQALLTYSFVVFVVLATSAVLSYRRKRSVASELFAQVRALVLQQADTSSTAVLLFERQLYAIAIWMVRVAAVIVCVFLLVYGVLGVYESSYAHKYTWQVSIAYLTGQRTGVLLFVLFLVFAACLLVRKGAGDLFWIGFWDSVDVGGEEEQSAPSSLPPLSFSSTAGLLGRTLLLLALNATIVLVVNGVYVYLIISEISDSAQVALIVGMALFKTLWRLVVLRAADLPVGQQLRNRFGRMFLLRLLCWVCLGNNLMVPCIASVFLNVNCFYYAVVPQGEVQTDVCFSACSLTVTTDGSTTCVSEVTTCLSTAYQPAFSYNYLCSSSLLASYVDIWLYMFLLSGLVFPCCSLLLLALFERPSWWQSHPLVLGLAPYRYYPRPRLLALLGRSSAPSIFSPETSGPLLTASAIFDARNFVVLQQNYLVLVLALGLLFPPIALVGAVAVCVHCVMARLYVLRILAMSRDEPRSTDQGDPSQQPAPSLSETSDVERPTHSRETVPAGQWAVLRRDLEAECSVVSCAELARLVSTSIGLVALVWSMFLWEIMGDEVGWAGSVWVVPVLVCSVVLLRFLGEWQRGGRVMWSTGPRGSEVSGVSEEVRATELAPMNSSWKSPSSLAGKSQGSRVSEMVSLARSAAPSESVSNPLAAGKSLDE